MEFDDPELMKLRMNPDDARLYNINDGDVVEIYNIRGAVRIKVYLDAMVQRGTLVTLWRMVQSQSSDDAVALMPLLHLVLQMRLGQYILWCASEYS